MAGAPRDYRLSTTFAHCAGGRHHPSCFFSDVLSFIPQRLFALASEHAQELGPSRCFENARTFIVVTPPSDGALKLSGYTQWGLQMARTCAKRLRLGPVIQDQIREGTHSSHAMGELKFDDTKMEFQNVCLR